MALTSRERTRLAQLIFLVAWLFGNLAVIAGLESAEGLLQSLGATCAFIVACGLWWFAWRLSNFGIGGHIVVALWMSGLLWCLFDFHFYARQPFFWMYTAVLIALICVLTVSQARSVKAR